MIVELGEIEVSIHGQIHIPLFDFLNFIDTLLIEERRGFLPVHLGQVPPSLFPIPQPLIDSSGGPQPSLKLDEVGPGMPIPMHEQMAELAHIGAVVEVGG